MNLTEEEEEEEEEEESALCPVICDGDPCPSSNLQKVILSNSWILHQNSASQKANAYVTRGSTITTGDVLFNVIAP